MTFSPIRSNCDEKCFANCKVIGRNLGIKGASQPERPIFQPNWTCLRWYELFLPIGGAQLRAAIGWYVEQLKEFETPISLLAPTANRHGACLIAKSWATPGRRPDAQ